MRSDSLWKAWWRPPAPCWSSPAIARHTQTHEAETTHAVDLLNELVQLEYDTMAVYRTAIDRVDSVDARTELALFFDDHERSAQALTACIERYGGTKVGMDLETAWAKAHAAIADVAGDEALLGALAHREDDIHSAYERAQADLRALADPPLASALESALAAEEFHREWLLHGGS
jgi:bacterioferritin (cytochrome b1)